jgi:UTP:GlnB (protein PII) uridylyltransferase
MALTVKKATLWRRELENRTGTLAQALKPFAKSGVSLQVVMGYTSVRPDGTSAVEVFPVTDAASEQVAKQAGLHQASEVHCLTVEGSDRAGIAYDITNTLASAGINLHFAMCQAIGKQFHAVFGFGNDKDAEKALGLISSL